MKIKREQIIFAPSIVPPGIGTSVTIVLETLQETNLFYDMLCSARAGELPSFVQLKLIAELQTWLIRAGITGE